MLKIRLILFLLLLSLATSVDTKAQCSICTRTAQQMGERPAKDLNLGIIYLGVTPFAILAIIGYKWWKNNRGE